MPTPNAFSIVGRARPFALVSPGFEQVVVEPAPLRSLRDSGVSPVVPFAAIEIPLESAPGAVLAGLLDAEGDGVLVELGTRGRMRILVVHQGRRRVLRRGRISGTAQRMAFVLCENQVTAVVDVGAGWQAVVTEKRRVAPVLDLRDPAVLSRLSYVWGPVDGVTETGAVRAGPFGMVGVRDPHLVQHADGTPYVRDGRHYLTMTCAGMGFFTQAHWGVFSFDAEAPEQLTQEAHLFSRRDGLVLGDHAGQLVVEGDTVRAAVSSWGDFDRTTGVHLRHARCGLDVLKGLHVLETEPLSTPTRHSAWDPCATVIDGRWHLAFVESPSQRPFDFHPALAAGPVGGGWGERLRLVGADTGLDQCEGPVLARVDGAWRLLASDGRGRRFVAYDLQMRRVGTVPAPYGTNIPHPQLVPLPAGSAAGSELLMSFDGTAWCQPVLGYGTHGDLVVMAR